MQSILVRGIITKLESRAVDGFSTIILFIIGALAFGNTCLGFDGDVRLNVVVSSTGKLTNDEKGTYYTGRDGVAAWLDPTRWTQMSFDICMDWPFSRYPGAGSTTAPPPTGARGNRTLIHRMTDPVKDGGGTSLGAFKSPSGNDVAISKPLTSRVGSFSDMAAGSFVSPESAEVRFCNSDCTEYYSLIFGARSLFYQDTTINGAGTSKPTVTRTSENTWTISFPAKTIGRLWRRSGQLTDLGLYYYDGKIDIQKQ